MLDSLPGLIATNGNVLKSIFSESIGVKIGHMNAQSMNPNNPKFPEIYDFLLSSGFDIICICETWWKDHINDSAVELPGYRLFRCDRAGRVGGGVAMYFSSRFKCRLVRSVSDSKFEFLAVSLVGTNTCFVALYLPPSSCLSDVEQEISSISNMFTHKFIVGDFNQNYFKNTCFNNLNDLVFRNGLTLIHNNLPSHYDTFWNSMSLLDYFLVSNSELVIANAQAWVPSSISKHAFICLQVLLPDNTPEPHKLISFRNFNGINQDQLSCDASMCDLSNIYFTNDTDRQLAVINNTIKGLLEKHAPIKYVRVNSKNKYPFMNSSEISSAKELRQLAFECFIKQPPGANKDRLKGVYHWHRNRVNNLIKKKKKEYSCRVFNTENSTKKTWNLINEGGLSDAPCKLPENVDLDKLNQHFAGSNTSYSYPHFDFLERPDEFSFFHITIDDLWEATNSIKSNAIGHDLIPLRFIKLIFPILGVHILHLFNTILTTNQFPSSWKIALVMPLPKVKTPNSEKDFRPISKLPIFSKAFEVVIMKQISQRSILHSKLYSLQSGFKKHHNTTSSVLELTESIRLNIQEKQLSFLISFDFKNAFGEVDFEILIRKLWSQYLFSPTSCKLLMSYLSGRSQCVEMNNEFSSFVSLYKGVPQGSKLGPLLFSAFVNDLPNQMVHSKSFLFADDFQLFFTCPKSKVDYFLNCINQDIAKVEEWASTNHMILNPLKTTAICFSRSNSDKFENKIFLNGVAINFVDKIKCLGFTINKFLTWDDHINTLIRNINFYIMRLRNLNYFIPLTAKKLVANGILVSRFLCGLEVFSGTSIGNLDKLRVCFNNIVRYVYGIQRYEHISSYVTQFIGCSLDKFIAIRILYFFYKLIFYQAPRYLTTRFKFLPSQRMLNLQVPLHTTIIMQQSFTVRAVENWNQLVPTNLRRFDKSPFIFKKCLKECL